MGFGVGYRQGWCRRGIAPQTPFLSQNGRQRARGPSCKRCSAPPHTTLRTPPKPAKRPRPPHLVDAGVLHQGRARGGPKARHNVYHALRDAFGVYLGGGGGGVLDGEGRDLGGRRARAPFPGPARPHAPCGCAPASATSAAILMAVSGVCSAVLGGWRRWMGGERVNWCRGFLAVFLSASERCASWRASRLRKGPTRQDGLGRGRCERPRGRTAPLRTAPLRTPPPPRPWPHPRS